jgi:hypothetical protein
VRYEQRDIQVFKNKDAGVLDILFGNALWVHGKRSRHDDNRMGYGDIIDRREDELKYVQRNERKFIIMKKLILAVMLLCLVGVSAFAGSPAIRVGNTGGQTSSAYESLWFEVRGAVHPTADIVWYADNIAGYSSIDFYGMAVSSGNTPTTISAQAVYANGSPIGSEQILTSGTDLTDIRSAYYKFTLPAFSVTRNVSFNFLIAD